MNIKWIEAEALEAPGGESLLAGANGILVSGLIKERVGAERRSVSDLQRKESAEGFIDALLPWTGRDSRLLGVAIAGLLGMPRAGLVWAMASSNLRLVRRLSAARAMLREEAGARLDGHLDPDGVRELTQ